MSFVANFKMTIAPATRCDKRKPWITSIQYDALSNRVFMADNSNSSLKYVSLKDPSDVKVMDFEQKPRRLALMKGQFLAITLDNHKVINIVDIRGDGLSVVKRIPTQHYYRGIAALDPSTLAVTTFNTGRVAVDMITLEGEVVKTLAEPCNALGLISPDYLCVGSEGQLYVSDWASHRLYLIDVTTGKVKDILTHSNMTGPCEMSLDRCGRLYVACQAGSCVMVKTACGNWTCLLQGGRGGDELDAKNAIGISVGDTARPLMLVSWDRMTISANNVRCYELCSLCN